MRFLTSEDDLHMIDYHKSILMFYSSKQDLFITEIMLDFLLKLDKNIEIICIDLSSFKTMRKRFDINELPTVIINNSSFSKRIIGLPSENDLNYFLTTTDI